MPRRGFPTPKQSAGLFRLPSCAFVKKEISLRAQSDQRRCLWILPPLKRRAKLYMRADSSQIRFLFRPTERFISCRGGSLRPPARLQQSRFRAMKEKSKIKLPARFTARWHAPRIRCARRHADSRKGCPYDSIKPASGSGKEKYYPATCSNSVHAGACHKTGKTTVQIPGYERKSKIKLPTRIRCTPARATSFC